MRCRACGADFQRAAAAAARQSRRAAGGAGEGLDERNGAEGSMEGGGGREGARAKESEAQTDTKQFWQTGSAQEGWQRRDAEPEPKARLGGLA